VTRGDKYVSVANATEDDIEVVIDETTLVRKDHKTGKKFGIGAAPLAGAAKLEVDLGDTSYETLTAKAQPHDVGPHSQWRVLVPPSAMQLRGLSMNVTNSINQFFISLCIAVLKTNYDTERYKYLYRYV